MPLDTSKALGRGLNRGPRLPYFGFPDPLDILDEQQPQERRATGPTTGSTDADGSPALEAPELPRDER